MGFRRKSRNPEAVQAWSDWRWENAALIAATGLPGSVFQFENWEIFTESGLLLQSDAELQSLTSRQKMALLRLLTCQPPSLNTHLGHHLVQALLDTVEECLGERHAEPT